MGDLVWTGEQDGAGRDMGDKGDPVGTGRDRENPAGTQGTQQGPGDKGGPVVPGERGWARGTRGGSRSGPGSRRSRLRPAGTWFPESGEAKRWLWRLRPVPRWVRRMACPQRTGVPRSQTAAVRPRTRQ